MAATHHWRVPRKIPAGKVAVAVVVALVAVPAVTDRWQVPVVAVVVAGLIGWAVRDLVAPVRLAADQVGVTVGTGFAGRRRLSWAEVERIRVDVRRRSRMLEIDTGDRLYLYSRYDLDADLDAVAGTLRRLAATAG